MFYQELRALRGMALAPAVGQEAVPDVNVLQVLQEFQAAEADQPASALLDARHPADAMDLIAAKRFRLEWFVRAHPANRRPRPILLAANLQQQTSA